MTHVVTDLLERDVGLDQPLHAAVPECMRTRAPDFDAGASQINAGSGGHRPVTDAAKGCRQADEQVAIGALGTSVAQVVDDRLADRRRQWIGRRVAGLTAKHVEPRLRPVDRRDLKCRNLLGTQAVGCEQHQDRIVALATSRATINAREDAFDIAPRYRSGNRRLLVRAPAGYRAAEIRRDDPLSAQIPQQDAQRTGSALPSTGLNARGTVYQESVNERRRECRQIGDLFR